MELTYLDVPITKAERQSDGSVIVYGPCTTDDVDSDRQIIDANFAATGLAKWLQTGANIREMHQPKAIGLGMEIERVGGKHFLKARIVEPTAATLAENRVLRAYSVGISSAKIVKDAAAPGGRIIDGEFVEVSLVDRPANAACKVDLVSKMADGSAHFTDILVKAEGEDDGGKMCPTCKGDGKIRNGKVKCPDCNGTGKMTAEKLYALRAVQLVEEMAAATKAAEKDSDGDGVPDTDEKVTAALQEASEAQAEDNKEHMDGGDEDDEEANKYEAPYAVKRLHDHLCAAYTDEALKAAYPTVASFADVVDPGYWAQRVTEVIGIDGGSGTHAKALAKASQMYGLVAQLNKADSDIVAEARAILVKAFADEYPSVHVTPGAITPGMFKRPPLTAGRESLNPSKPRIPMAANTPNPNDFDRGYITDGRAANSPSAGPPHTATKAAELREQGLTWKAIGLQLEVSADEAKELVKGRQFYTNNARDQMLATIEQAHDLLAAAHPGCCPMSAETAKADDPSEGGDGTPAPDAPEIMPNHADAHPTDASLSKGLLLADVQKMIDKAVGKVTAEAEKKIRKAKRKQAEAEEQLAQLAKMADPEANAYRGGRGVVPLLPKSDTQNETQDAAEQVEVEKRERVSWLVEKIRTSTDPAEKRQALEALQDSLSPDEFAEVLVNSR